jgi:hypothetical protein
MIRPKQQKALLTLFATGSVTEAAAEAGVTRKTFYKWLKTDDFRQAILTVEAEALEALSRSLLSMADLAVATLRNAMTDKAAPAASKIRAAEITLDRLQSFRELAEFETRLKTLEELIHNGKR